MNKRESILARIKYAGYHKDTALGTRLYIENRVSVSVYREYWNKGVQAKIAGAKCNCELCKTEERI